MPPPPYSSGTSSCQMPSSLARVSRRSRYSGLIVSPSVVWRSIGINSLSTKRRSPALRMRNSSGSSKSMPSRSLPLPGRPDVDRDRAMPRSTHDERIDLDVAQPGAMVEKEAAERERCGFERGAIGVRSSAKPGKERRELQAVDHRGDVVRAQRKQPQRGVLGELDQHAAGADEQHRSVKRIAAR